MNWAREALRKVAQRSSKRRPTRATANGWTEERSFMGAFRHMRDGIQGAIATL
jgi:hypothetical protein